MQVYKSAIRSFLPMPSKSHYVFNLRDFARVVRGVLLVPSSRMTEPDKMIRLWIHEVYRVFNDRLTDDADRSVSPLCHLCSPEYICAFANFKTLGMKYQGKNNNSNNNSK